MARKTAAKQTANLKQNSQSMTKQPVHLDEPHLCNDCVLELLDTTALTARFGLLFREFGAQDAATHLELAARAALKAIEAIATNRGLNINRLMDVWLADQEMTSPHGPAASTFH